MAKKMSSKSDVTESVHKVWLAGLGALATAEEEGSKLFNVLVNRGRKFERSARKPVDRAAHSVKGTVQEVRGHAEKTFKKIEKAFDDRVDAALRRVGVPTRKEIAALTRKVDRLTKSIAMAKGGSARAAKKKVARKTPKKTAARR
jgi:poly(hydroxyalkanoate) granule-associated protein